MHFLSVLLVVALSGQAAQGQPSAQELIAKFRKAIGGDSTTGSIPFLIQYRGQRFLYEMRDGKLSGESFDYEAKLYGITDKYAMRRKEMELRIGIVPVKMIEVINGEKGWYQINEGEAVAMSKAEIDGRNQREHHVEVFLGRENFDPKRWQLSEPKSTQVHGQDAWWVEARTKGLEPLDLYFAKQSGLLLRLTTKTSDFSFFMPGEKPKIETFTRDLYFRDWKTFGKRMLPGRLAVFHDGVLWEHLESVDVSFLPSLDPNLFAEPKSKK
jgi:hypothetical protein